MAVRHSSQKLHWLVLVPGLFLAAGTWAPDAAVQLPGVQVQDAGNRLVYGAEFFRQFNVVSVSDQLERVPGIGDLLSGTGGDQRGFGNAGDQILINGRRVSGKSNEVDDMLDRLQARQVVQIEVIRGTVPGLDVRSQGRIVNVVLDGRIHTGYGAWTAGARQRAGSRPGASGELSYNADAGALSYVLALEGSMQQGRENSRDLFFSPDLQLSERQDETADSREDDYALSASVAYALSPASLLNLNLLVQQEQEDGLERTLAWSQDGGSIQWRRGRLRDERQQSGLWELGGDLRHRYVNGDSLSLLLILSRDENDETGYFYDLPSLAEQRFEELQIEDSRGAESILRGVYAWKPVAGRNIEAGLEVAVNRVEESARLFGAEAGAADAMPVLDQGSVIEEQRLEAFVNYNWQASGRLLLQASVDLERSMLHQQGLGVDQRRTFFFARPRLALRFDLDPQVQLRGRIERSVSQLDFGDFVDSFLNDDNRADLIVAGNPGLVPQQAWEYALTYERQFLRDRGMLALSATYADVSDHVGRIPLLVEGSAGTRVRTATGNIGDGYEAGLALDLSLRLDWLGLRSAVLDLGTELQRSSVVDPFTGQTRAFDSNRAHAWSLGFRQDRPWKKLAYGLTLEKEAPQLRYDLDYRQEEKQPLDLEVFVELQATTDLTVRLQIDNILRPERQRKRLQYTGMRGDSLLERVEWRSTEAPVELRLSIQGVF